MEKQGFAFIVGWGGAHSIFCRTADHFRQSIDCSVCKACENVEKWHHGYPESKVSLHNAYSPNLKMIKITH